MAIKVYLSSATPHTSCQERFLAHFKQTLLEKGLDCQTVVSSNIRTNDSIGAIIQTLKDCYGLVTVAYERKLIISAVNKREADLPGMSSSSLSDVKESTPYIHIEAALAAAYELPVILFKENGLLEEGVLEPYCLGITGPKFDLNDDVFFSSPQFIEAIDAFCAEVKKLYIERNKFSN